LASIANKHIENRQERLWADHCTYFVAEKWNSFAIAGTLHPSDFSHSAI
jgi:hypothetical protein